MSSSALSSFELAPGVSIGPDHFPVIAGPCAIESPGQLLETAHALAGIANRLGLELIFKASYDKANRSAVDSFRGPGLDEGLKLLARVRDETGLPLLTDVHEVAECAPAAEVCDVIQVPALLCRQTDLILAAAETGRPVNLKKGQFMAPADMAHAVAKARSRGNEKLFVTERGASFGYHDLVVDLRSFPILHEKNIPVLYDATHSLQLPGGRETGGRREFAEPLARGATAAGADGLYLEVHPEPGRALSDSATQLDPAHAERLLGQVLAIRRALRPSPA